MNAVPADPSLKYLLGYPPDLLAQVREAVASGRAATALAQRYAERHEVRTDRALHDYVDELRSAHLRNSQPLSKVAYDQRLQLVAQALGTHTAVSRVQGGKLKSKREIRIAAVFKDAPADFLCMIVVHELAHLRHREHDKAFYALCCHMERDYHQLEFDLRLWLGLREAGRVGAPGESLA